MRTHTLKERGKICEKSQTFITTVFINNDKQFMVVNMLLSYVYIQPHHFTAFFYTKTKTIYL